MAPGRSALTSSRAPSCALHAPAATLSRRRPRAHDDPAFSLPAAAAAATAAFALAAALRALLTRRVRRKISVSALRARRTLFVSATRLRRSASPRLLGGAPTRAASSTLYERLDAVSARAAVKLDEATSFPVAPDNPEDYASLSGVRRAELLEAAFATARSQELVFQTAGLSPAVTETKPEAKARAAPWDRQTMFWKMAENLNGRAAALGFALCLLREAVEPGHPTLLAQVKGVLVPVAVHTPPLLIAFLDGLQDIWEIIT